MFRWRRLALTPPNARVLGFIVVDNIAYAATSDGCNGTANGVWAVPLTGPDHTVSNWLTGGSNFAGSTGTAFGTDGTIYAATTAAITALEPRTLRVKDSFTPGGLTFNSSPVVLSRGDKELIAASARDGKDLRPRPCLSGRYSHKTPLAVSPAYATFDTDFTPGAPGDVSGCDRHANGFWLLRLAASWHSRSWIRAGNRRSSKAGNRER